MDGSAVFTFALRVVSSLIRDLCCKANLTPADVNWFVYHQANRFMLDELVKRSVLRPEKVVRHYEDVGNAVS